MRRAKRTLLFLICSSMACGSGAAVVTDVTPSAQPVSTPGFCGRPAADAVRDVFCGPEPVQIRSLLDLQMRLGLTFQAAEPDGTMQGTVYSTTDAAAFTPTLVLLNSSTSLSGKVVSTLNPRAIVLGPTAMMAFNRGVQQVELTSVDRDRGTINFYLVTFRQVCNDRRGGCNPGDLYTPRVESNWTDVRIEDDEELKNTAADCRQCHQRGLEQPVLLMRELEGPWTHFFGAYDLPPIPFPEPTGLDIVRAYHEAKGDEPYGNIPWSAIRDTTGFTLQFAVARPQPLVFDGSTIFNERWPWDPSSGFPATPRVSATWYGRYEAFKRGEHLALPHFEPFTSDPDKLARLSENYRAFLGGAISADDLQDMGDFHPDDPQVRAEMGLQTEPGANPAQALIQACGSCHNDVLDQSLSRARFSIDLTRMDRLALDEAIARMTLPSDAPGHMPPADFRQLDREALAPLIEYLQRETRPAEDDAALQHAAQIGMSTVVRPAMPRSPAGL